LVPGVGHDISPACATGCRNTPPSWRTAGRVDTSTARPTTAASASRCSTAAEARLAYSRDIVDEALSHLLEDETVFLHPAESACAECNQARKSIS